MASEDACLVDKTKVIEWTVPHIEKIFKKLYKDREVSGKIKIDTSKKRTTEDITTIEGDRASVESPKSIINYHTHPASCYVNEKTVWGFPSGEDTRESILFGLKGSIAHLVVGIEGTFVCQVNPCLLDNLIHLNIDIKSLDPALKRLITNEHKKSKSKSKDIQTFTNDVFRGFIVLCVEIYFRSTHGYRSLEYVNNTGGNKKPANSITPEDYLNFVNNFNFHNMFDNNENGCTKLKCNKVWAYGKKPRQLAFEKYVDEYEGTEKVYVCDKFGEIYISDIKIESFIKNGGIEPLRKINYTESDKYNFYTDSWFLTKIFYHGIKYNGKQQMYKDIPTSEKFEILKQISNGNTEYEVVKTTDAKFIFFDIKGNCDHNSIQDTIHKNNYKEHSTSTTGNVVNLKFGKVERRVVLPSDNFVFYGSVGCGYCIRFLDMFKPDHPAYNKTKINKDGDIRKAIDDACKVSGQKISSIPCLFHIKNGKYERIDHYKFLENSIIPYTK